MSEGWLRPTTVAETTELLTSRQPDARLVAGGTDLVVGVRIGKHLMPRVLIAVSEVEALGSLSETAGGMRFGSAVSHAQVCESNVARATYPALADACAVVGSPATRQTGTLGGNLCNASPAAESASPFLIFDATLRLESQSGGRQMAIEDFLLGPGKNAARPDELLTTIEVPSPPRRSGSAYLRLEGRKAMDIATAGCAALVSLDDRGLIDEARIALTAVAPTCVRARAAEHSLHGREPTREALREAAGLAAQETAPISDARASAEYRRRMIAVLSRRALELALERCDPASR